MSRPFRFSARRAAGGALLAAGLTGAGCHALHDPGKLPGGTERAALTLREAGWTVEARLRTSGEHVDAAPLFRGGPTDWWRLEHQLFLTPPSGGARPVGELWSERATARRDARSEIEEAFAKTRVVGCSDGRGRVLVRVEPPPSHSVVAEASFWRGMFLLRRTALVLPLRIAGADCAAALAEMPTAAAWLETALRSEQAVPRTEELRSVRDGDPILPEGRVEPWQSQKAFVVATREGLATGAALDHVFDSDDFLRSVRDLGPEISALADAVARDPSLDDHLAQRLLPGRRNNGSQWAESGDRVHAYALDATVQTIVAALPPERRSRLVDTLLVPWLAEGGAAGRESRDYWKLRVAAAATAKLGPRERCDRLLARMPALMAEAGDWHEHYATTALRDLPGCASPELVLSTARTILAPRPSPSLSVERDYHAVSVDPCRLDAAGDVRIGCRSAPFRAAQILVASCDDASLAAARKAQTSPFFSPRSAAECLLARCEKRPVAPRSAELLFVDACRTP